MLKSPDNKQQYELTAPFPASFDIPYRFFTKTEIKAYLSFDGKNPQELIHGTDFSLTDPADTGTLFREREWDESAIRLTICREMPVLQNTNLIQGDKIDAEVIEQVFDKLVAMMQQVAEVASRSIQIPLTDDGTEKSELPAREDRINSFITGDSEGNLSVAKGLLSVPASTLGALLIGKLIAADMRDVLEVYGQDDVYSKDEVYAKSETYTQNEVDAIVAAERKKPPIGIPTMWFSSVPDWALAFDDGSGPYDWEDYPELDNTAFKAILTTWSTAGWMTAYDGTSFYVPDLRGMFPRLAGTNAVRNSRYAGGSLGAYGADQMQRITGNTNRTGAVAMFRSSDPGEGALSIGDPTTTSRVTPGETGTGYNIDFNSANSPDARTSTTTDGETRPAYFALRLVVRFE